MINKLTKEEIEIALIQREIKSLGWQWKEHIFNDGHSDNCHVEFHQSKNPNAFQDDFKHTIGWGRFSRIHCWQSALSAIKK